MGVSALKLREGRGFRNECGDWRASGAHAKPFWEVCPKQGKSKAEEPSLRKWGLIGTRWMGDPSLLAGRETEPIPISARPSRPGQKGARAARCQLGAEMPRWLPLEGGGEGGGCTGPTLSFSFSSFKLHASSQRCHIPPFCTGDSAQAWCWLLPSSKPQTSDFRTLLWVGSGYRTVPTDSKCQPPHSRHHPSPHGGCLLPPRISASPTRRLSHHPSRPLSR